MKKNNYVEIIVPTSTNEGSVVVFNGKRYIVIEKLEEVHINGLLSYALGEEVGDY